MNTLDRLARAQALGEDDRGCFHGALDIVQAVALLMGAEVAMPAWATGREAYIRATKKGRLAVGFDRVPKDPQPAHFVAKGKGHWEIVTLAKVDQRPLAEQAASIDHFLRELTTPEGESTGTHLYIDGQWCRFGNGLPQLALLAMGYTEEEAKILRGLAVRVRWRLTKRPFEPEYPGNREWNKDAPQHAYKPAAGIHPHWTMVFDHCGRDLDAAISQLDWAQSAGIKTGGDYLLCWTACMLREPSCKLPYLFLWGEQNSGKSTLGEALSTLMTHGAVSADRALTNANDFNGELANGVLALIEEKDISSSPGAYNKIKDWVTSPFLWVRKMRTDAYRLPNTLHFVQTANSREACPIYPGDTRIVAMHVDRPAADMPKTVLMERLAEEGPAIMATIMGLTLPPIMGRLRLPVVDTDGKAALQESAADDFAVAVADFASGQHQWTGTLRELTPLLTVGDWPADRRRARTILDASSAYLRSRGISVAYLPRNEHGCPICLTCAKIVAG
jgi:hypothetical protein